MEKIDERLECIIRVHPLAWTKAIIESRDDPRLIQSLVECNGGKFLGHALQYAVVEIQAGLIKDLIADSQIRKIWHIDPRIFDPYFNILKNVDHVLSTYAGTAVLPAVANMSLGPPIDSSGACEFNEREPINIATRKLFDAGIVVVVVAGNSGRLGNNTLNPWSVAPWVIGVGAATKDGKKLADFSSRGIPGHELYKPTVVARGVDIESQGETISRTSFAAAHVSGAACNILGLMRQAFGFKDAGVRTSDSKNLKTAEFDIISGDWKKPIVDSGDRTFELEGPRVVKFGFIYGDYKKTIQFKIGTVESLSPTTIKELLIQCALPMSGYQMHEVGAGFLSGELVIKCIGDYMHACQIIILDQFPP